VLYVNGIALGILELKKGSVSVEKGIRQNLDNQKKDFIQPFFTTIQLVMAGNDTQGLRYGTIETAEKYYLTWKEENPDYNPKTYAKSRKYLPSIDEAIGDNPLDTALVRLCNKSRFLEIIHDFIVFDVGVKKTCRHNQYFGIKAAQTRIQQRDGGIIWHTQGSGKSLTMVWLAKWIREHATDARVLVITDRTELDEQIEGIFQGVDEDIDRSDITGATGMRIIRAIVAGERDPQRLAAMRDPRTKRSTADIAAALEGDYRAEHLFVLQQELLLYDTYCQQIAQCDKQIQGCLASFEDKSPPDVPLSP